jgi:hypothetical protein
VSSCSLCLFKYLSRNVMDSERTGTQRV